MLDAIGIVSEDAAKAVAFYRVLGIELARFAETEHYEGKSASGVRLMIDSAAVIRQFEPGWQRAVGTTVALAFKQASAAEVDAIYATLLAAGGTSRKAPWDAFWGQRYACVNDPDGTQIDLFAQL
jgi:uncharacterized glyoxalase superfamily protein PhnB